MSIQSHLAQLEQQHAVLKQEIEQALQHPSTDDLELAELKRRKLQIKDFTDPKIQAAFTDDQAVKVIKEGITQDGQLKMKAFGDKLSDDEIKSLIAHVRSLKL